MTALGYGNLVPVTPHAKTLAILMAFTGQVCVAVIIAMLVGKYISTSNSN